MRSLPSILSGLALAALLLQGGGSPHAAPPVAAGTGNEDYVAHAIREIHNRWTPPPGMRGEYTVRIEVSVDGTGTIRACRARKPSGNPTFDTAACGAAWAVGRLGPTPGTIPMSIQCTFRSERRRGMSVMEEDDPDKKLREAIVQREMDAAKMRTMQAGWAEDDARARAEAVAREKGLVFNGYEFVPGQDVPGAKDILEGPSRYESSSGEKRGNARPVAPGPVIGRYPPHPSESEDLKIAPQESTGHAATQAPPLPSPRSPHAATPIPRQAPTGLGASSLPNVSPAAHPAPKPRSARRRPSRPTAPALPPKLQDSMEKSSSSPQD